MNLQKKQTNASRRLQRFFNETQLILRPLGV